MKATVLLITPPFTQLNTPYPATAYLKGFLNTRKISSFQTDLGIEVILDLFSQKSLTKIFETIEGSDQIPTNNAARIIDLKASYIHSIDAVIAFLQGKNPTLAHSICKRDFLPEADRFAQTDNLDWAFGSMGIQDKAKHLATLYLEDLGDLIQECLDPHFGFSRYAEKLGRSANHFDELYQTLQGPCSFVDELMFTRLKGHLENIEPALVAISVPFPGNLYCAFRCGQWIKSHYPNVKIAMGGGFANTELRSLADPRVFEFFDFITLDDGEAPLEQLLKYMEGNLAKEDLKRCFILQQNEVTYYNNQACTDYRQGQVGTPDYSDLLLDQYISAIEVVNPMHRMWSDGRWNKLTLAHGCYWGKCTFCDVSLDYIKNYEPLTASLLADRMETIMAQTGQSGFHFVDEAAPPALLRALSLEIIRRRLVVTWWTNIRFEKSFTRDLCLLMKAAGCVAVSGGLEVASDRLLQLIQKGITVAQVAWVNQHFTEAGIMVHAYLMYGFPTQTAQETIDSLEMVRQMFKTGILQSGFWHLFTMTAHSPVGLNPQKFGVKSIIPTLPTFANNDVLHEDPTGADHELYSDGLKKSLFNYMNGLCLDDPLHKWFDLKIPKTTIAPDHIARILQQGNYSPPKPTARVVWLGSNPNLSFFTKTKKDRQWPMASIAFNTLKTGSGIQVGAKEGEWLAKMLEKLSIHNNTPLTLKEIMDDYENSGLEDFELFWDNKPVSGLYKSGLLTL